MEKVLEELNSIEKGWGGSKTIIGSPQGIDSQLNKDDVINIVKKHLLPFEMSH